MTEKVCKNCEYHSGGECLYISSLYKNEAPQSDGIGVYATALDDSGLSVQLKVGPNFGCNKFIKAIPF